MQPPSIKDTIGPPAPGFASKRNVSDLSALARHHDRSLRNLDSGLLGGRSALVKPVEAGFPIEYVGDDAGGGETDYNEIQFWNTDQFVIDGPGDQVFTLSYVPIQDGATSLHVRWVPLYVPSNNWSCADNILRVSDPGWQADDLVEVEYAYLDDGEPDPSDVIVDFAATGWKWLQVPFHDTGDYSSPSFDDSSWATAAGAFGSYTPPYPFDPSWAAPTTTWDQSSQMWARRTIAAEAGVPVTVSSRLNRTLILYWNGAYLGKTTAAEHAWTIDASLVNASNVAAFKATDDSLSGPGTGCYFDAQINQSVEETAP